MIDERHHLDDVLGELAEALRVEPSADFEARVLARAHADAYARRHWRQWATAALVAAAMLFALAATIARLRPAKVERPSRVASSERSVPAVQPPTSLPTRAPADLPAPTPVPIHLPDTAARSVVHGIGTRRIVLPPGQAEGVRQLARAAALGLVRFPAPTANAPDDGTTVAPLPALDPIRVSPLNIDPLAN